MSGFIEAANVVRTTWEGRRGEGLCRNKADVVQTWSGHIPGPIAKRDPSTQHCGRFTWIIEGFVEFRFAQLCPYMWRLHVCVSSWVKTATLYPGVQSQTSDPSACS